MLSTDEVLLEDWQGLESELERLFMIYGYPVDDLQGEYSPETPKPIQLRARTCRTKRLMCDTAHCFHCVLLRRVLESRQILVHADLYLPDLTKE